MNFILPTDENLLLKTTPQIYEISEIPETCEFVGFLRTKTGIMLRDTTGEDLMKFFLIPWDLYVDLKKLDRIKGAK